MQVTYLLSLVTFLSQEKKLFVFIIIRINLYFERLRVKSTVGSHMYITALSFSDEIIVRNLILCSFRTDTHWVRVQIVRIYLISVTNNTFIFYFRTKLMLHLLFIRNYFTWNTVVYVYAWIFNPRSYNKYA